MPELHFVGEGEKPLAQVGLDAISEARLHVAGDAPIERIPALWISPAMHFACSTVVVNAFPAKE